MTKPEGKRDEELGQVDWRVAKWRRITGAIGPVEMAGNIEKITGEQVVKFQENASSSKWRRKKKGFRKTNTVSPIMNLKFREELRRISFRLASEPEEVRGACHSGG